MWMMTTRGFFSAVHKNGDPAGVLTVRARVKGDLENLKDLLPDAVPYQDDSWTDYPWRIKVSAAEWAKVCAVLALDVDYHNFKDEVKVKQGSERATVYAAVWGVLTRLEPKKEWYSGGYSGLYEQERTRALKMTREGKTIKQIAKALGNGVTEKMVGNDFALKAARRAKKAKKGKAKPKQLQSGPPAGESVEEGAPYKQEVIDRLNGDVH